jgi:hypothetical protein
MAKIGNDAKPEDGGGQFEAFLGDVETFITQWCDKVRLSAENDSDAVMQLYQEGARNAWIGARGELSKIYQGLDLEGRRLLDQAVMISGMQILVQNANSLLSGGKLVSTTSLLNLGTIIEKIKSFILCILDCLGIHLPCIIRCLFILIDNFFRLFLGPVSRDYADYYLKLEDQVSLVRMQTIRETNLRKGCSCGGASDRD